MTPAEQAELLRIIKRLGRGGVSRRWLNMADLRRLAGEPIDEEKYKRAVVDCYHDETCWQERLEMQQNRTRKDVSPAMEWYENNR